MSKFNSLRNCPAISPRRQTAPTGWSPFYSLAAALGKPVTDAEIQWLARDLSLIEGRNHLVQVTSEPTIDRSKSGAAFSATSCRCLDAGRAVARGHSHHGLLRHSTSARIVLCWEARFLQISYK